MCDFPARRLAKMAYAMTLRPEWDRTEKAAYAFEFIHAAGELGAAHQELTGCDCWVREAARALARLDHPPWWRLGRSVKPV